MLTENRRMPIASSLLEENKLDILPDSYFYYTIGYRGVTSPTIVPVVNEGPYNELDR
jgi:hypothetical protein